VPQPAANNGGAPNEQANDQWVQRVGDYMEKTKEFREQNPGYTGPPPFEVPPPPDVSNLFGPADNPSEAGGQSRPPLISSDEVARYGESLALDAMKDKPVLPINTALQQWVAKQYNQFVQKAIDDMVYKQPLEQMSEEDRLWITGPREIVQHAFKAILQKRYTETSKVSQPVSRAFELFMRENAHEDPSP
jgi:hypothetical protein